MIYRSDNQREQLLFYLILLSSWRSLQMSESFGECGEYRWADSPVNGHASPSW